MLFFGRCRSPFTLAFATFSISSLSIISPAVSQEIQYLDPGYYAVVGVFKFERNAGKFREYVMEKGEAVVEYAYYPPKEYYYVHVGNFPGYSDTRDKVMSLRPDPDFEEAWVFKAEPYDRAAPLAQQDSPVAVPAKEADPEPSEPMEAPMADEPEEMTQAEEVVDIEEDTTPSVEMIEEAVETEPESGPAVLATGTAVAATATNGNESDEVIAGTQIYVNTYRARNLKEVTGEVQVVNPERSQRITNLETHSLNVLPEDINRSGDIQLICDIFGYKKVQHDVNLNDPVTESTSSFASLDGDTLVVDFALSRLTKGDIVTMYNVYFYKDAAIMRPESQYELGQLLEMLQENASYRIKLHGHTNGNASGPIIYRGEGDRGFFARTPDSKEGWGSAKKLSGARAQTIMDYLVTQGVEEARMEAKGWGGKKGVYDKHDNLAYLNVRVEVEIVEDGT